MTTAHKTEEEKKEYFDPPEVLDKKCQELAKWIKNSKHFVAFTGAGISTSAGIPDFRSGLNTVLPTGPGVWEKAAAAGPVPPAKVAVARHAAIPTPSHMSLIALEKAGYLKYLITQNTDGMHLKSGFPAEKMSELHGNTNLEICAKCGNRYLRDYQVRTAKTVHDHVTGRPCDDPKCRGELRDSIINFGENLPEKDMELGFENAKIADLHLCLGSSLRVTPAANMPEKTAKKKGKLVIVNLQATPLDDLASLRIHGMIDDVMGRVMKYLEIPIPEFALTRRFGIFRPASKDELPVLKGLDVKGNPFSIFKGVRVFFSEPKSRIATFVKEPYALGEDKIDVNIAKAKIFLEFQGHYAEPDFEFEFDFGALKAGEGQVFELKYSPFVRKWFQFDRVK